MPMTLMSISYVSSILSYLFKSQSYNFKKIGILGSDSMLPTLGLGFSAITIYEINNKKTI